MSLPSLPEELTDRIFQFAVHPDILKTCSQFHRIALPHLYNHVVLSTKRQSTLFLQSSHSHLLKSLVVTVDAFTPELLTSDLQSLDIELLDVDVDIDLPPSLTHLTIRKPPTAAYLSSDNTRRFIYRLAQQLPPTLTTVHVAFKLSDPTLDSASPVTHLARSLASLPNLHTFITLLPSVWSEVLLLVSSNLSLRRITLGQGIVPTGLFMNTAVKHPRLMELIRAGTPIIRHRAQTLPQTAFPPSLITTSCPRPSTKKQQPPSPQSAHPHNTRVLQRRWSNAHP